MDWFMVEVTVPANHVQKGKGRGERGVAKRKMSLDDRQALELTKWQEETWINKGQVRWQPVVKL